MLPQCHLVSDHFPGPYPYGGWRREDGKILSSGSCQVRRRLRVPGCYGASNKEVGVWGERRGKGYSGVRMHRRWKEIPECLGSRGRERKREAILCEDSRGMKGLPTPTFRILLSVQSASPCSLGF